jgi:dTDP-4-amino-4,6-dideoxygalactose transaminase
MPLSPQPRFRLYGSSRDRLTAAVSALIGQTGRGGRYVADIEQRVAERTGSPHAIALPQARLGLYLALLNLIRPGQKVVLSPYTIYDVINMVVCAGGYPVFADIEAETCNIDARQVESLVDDSTGAVIATHLHGLACDIERIAEVCRARKVPLIEDAAQCFGGRVNGRHVGTFGDVGVFSFSLNKNVNALYGGMAIMRDQGLRDRIFEALATFPPEDNVRLLRQAAKCLLGDLATAPLVFPLTFRMIRGDYLSGDRVISKLLRHTDASVLRREMPDHYRRRMTNAQARLIARQLADVDRLAQLRLEHARAYHRGLSGIREVRLPPLREDGSHTYLTFPIRVLDRAGLVKYMLQHGRDIRPQHYPNAADLACFSEYARDCPNARANASQVVILPSYPSYRATEVEKNIAVIQAYFRLRTASAPSRGSVSR